MRSRASKPDSVILPGTRDFGRSLRVKMAHIFITKPCQNIGYVLSHPKRGLFGSFIDGAFTTIGLVHFISETTFSHFFDLKHFSCHIEPVKPKRPRYRVDVLLNAEYYIFTNCPALSPIFNTYVPAFNLDIWIILPR